jgi:hypothetical protein
MKLSLAIVLLGLTPSLSFASYSIRRASTNPEPHTWFCTADGYDASGQLRSISGALKNSRTEAENDALHACMGFYTNCSVSSCFQEQ